MINFYQILEVEKTASQSEIKAAFRKLSFRYHPDLNNHPEAEEMFKRVNEAYQVLSDPLLKKIYDERYINGKVNYKFSESNIKYRGIKEKRTYRNVLSIFIFFIVLFVIFQVFPSFNSVRSENEYKANLSKKYWEYFLNSQERDKQIDVIIRRTNSLVDMFRNIP